MMLWLSLMRATSSALYAGLLNRRACGSSGEAALRCRQADGDSF